MRRLLVGLSMVTLATAGLFGLRPPVASAATAPTLTIAGHGWGHGRGMGQWGADGYALAGWNYQQILAHYYGGTKLAGVNASQPIQVWLTELSGPVAYRSPSGSGQLGGAPVNGPVSLAWPGGGWRTFDGTVAISGGRVINTVPLDQYVEGVVPREAYASWPQAALQAQAVAARSYALAYLRGSPTNTICDSSSCQAYGGDPAQYGLTANSAVTSTAEQILIWPANGQPALTEYSASTGGYTAGGQFPAVVDAGDAVAQNPNHSWTTTVSATLVASTFGVGALRSVQVTQRNGLGDWGGRVLQVAVTGTTRQVTVSGDQFAGWLGLKSDWFAITAGLVTASGGDNGYWIVDSRGGVFPFGKAGFYGSTAGLRLNAPVVGMAPSADGAGYWVVAGDGGIFSYGDARFYGSTGGMRLNRPVIGMAPTPRGQGYWLYASDGGTFSFGDAHFYGSTGSIRLNRPVVGMAATPSGHGYWLVASDGGIFAFGDARFYGSMGGRPLNQPVVGMVPTGDGRGYWLVARDGGIFAFGDAGFVGSLPGLGVAVSVVGVAPTADGRGYLVVTAGGQVYAFGDAPFLGDLTTSGVAWTSPALGIFAHRGS